MSELKIAEFQKQVHEAAKNLGWWDSNNQKVVNVIIDGIQGMGMNHKVNLIVEELEAQGLITKRSPLDAHMLMVSELAEATEEVRKKTPPHYVVDSHSGSIIPVEHNGPMFTNESVNSPIQMKPEGELVELADTVIRILDYCGAKGYDLEKAIMTKFQYNQTRSHRHGGKAF